MNIICFLGLLQPYLQDEEKYNVIVSEGSLFFPWNRFNSGFRQTVETSKGHFTS